MQIDVCVSMLSALTTRQSRRGPRRIRAEPSRRTPCQAIRAFVALLANVTAPTSHVITRNGRPLSTTMHAIMDNMIATLTLFLLASAPQTTTFTGEWLITWDQMNTQYIRVSVTQDGAAAKVTWENESFQCTFTNNAVAIAAVCEGTVTENNNPNAGKVKITIKGDEIKGEGADLEGAFTFIGKRPPAPPPGGPTTHKFEPTVFYNYFAWN